MIAPEHSNYPQEDPTTAPQQPAAFSGVNPDIFKMGVNVVASRLNMNNPQLNEISKTLEESQAQIPPYFAVTRETVLHRLKNMLCPFIVKDWARSVPDRQKANPLNNPNAAELYTPLLLTFSYFLLSAIIMGLQGKFSLGSYYIKFLYFFLYIFAQALISRFILFANLETTYPLLTFIADYLCISFYLIIICFFSFNKAIKIVITIYCAISCFQYTLRTLHSEPGLAGRQAQTTSKLHTYFLLGVSFVHAIMVFIFAPSVRAAAEAVVETISNPTNNTSA